jgi:uncharacterized RDD family membrane protein YckC
MDREQHRDAQARLERDYLAGELTADEYTRLRRELHESVAGGGDSPALPAVLRYAGWGRRAAALLLDSLILIAALVMTLAWGAAVPVFFAIILLPSLYHWLMVGARGQTLGKMALGERVVRATDAGAVGYARAFGRVACVWALGFFVLPLLLAYLWPLWDKRNQTLYDKMVDTVVVRVR